jgi:hypothetical protein
MPMRPRSGRLLNDSPQEVVIQLFRRRRFEGKHLAPAWVHTRHHVLDRAVLAGRVHGLEHEQHRPPVLGIQLVLKLAQPLDARGQQLGGRLLGLEAARVVRVDMLELELLAVRDPKRLDELVDAAARWQARHAHSS